MRLSKPGRGRPTATTQWWGCGLQAAAPAALGEAAFPATSRRGLPVRGSAHVLACSLTPVFLREHV